MKHIVNISLILVFFLSFESKAQFNRSYETNPDRKRANIWYFGQFAGIDFSTLPPTSLADGKVNILEEGGGIISDTSGKVMFYTDGRTVWDRNHDTMYNGYGLKGHFSASQTGLIIKHPENDSLYYIFNTPYSYDYSDGLSYSIVNINLNNGLGGIIIKNKSLNRNSSEKISAIYHSNGRDIWIIGHEYDNNRFFKYLLQANGINNCPTFQDTGVKYYFVPPNGSGQFMNQGFIKFSPDNKFMAHIYTPEYFSIQYRRFELYDFNNLTGNLSLITNINFEKWAWDVEFSQNSENLIFSDRDSFSSIYNIRTGLKKRLKIKIDSQFESIPLQLAPDGNIYFSRLDSTFIGIISNADEYQNVEVIEKYINLQTGKCKYSLPNLFASYFYTPSIDYTYEYNCTDNSSLFEGRDTFYADTHDWKIFKPGKQIEATYASKNINHHFKDTGAYHIRYIASKGNRSDTVLKTIVIYPKIRKDFLGRDTAFETGTVFTKSLKAPIGMHCYLWHNDSSASYTFTTDTIGTFVCKLSSQSFCEVIDTIVLSNCINDMETPTIERSRDSLFVSHQLADSFVWFRNGELYRITKVPFLKLTDTGSYRVEAAKKGHCNKSSDFWIVNKLGIVSNILIPDVINVYPNPANALLSIKFEKSDSYEIRIYDLLGQVIFSFNTYTDIDIDTSEFPSGIYLLHVTNTRNQQFNTKILKE